MKIPFTLPAVRRKLKFLLITLREKAACPPIRGFLPVCGLTLAVALTAALSNLSAGAGLSELESGPPVPDTPENITEGDSLSSTSDSAEFADEFFLDGGFFAEDREAEARRQERVELLSTDGFRAERILSRRPPEPEIPDRIWLLSTEGFRMEQRLDRHIPPDTETEFSLETLLAQGDLSPEEFDELLVQAQEAAPEPGPAEEFSLPETEDGQPAQFAVLNNTVYAFEEQKERWIVIDNSLAGSSDGFSAAENAEKVYFFAKEVLGVNTAAACGILANIRDESSFNPHAVFVEADGRVSYGICQWNAGRLLALHEYCERNGYDHTTLSGQLQYLQYELTNRERAAFSRVKNVPDSGNGAYIAGYNWARYFERCASRYHVRRAETAYSTYWARYGNTNERFILSIIGETFPTGVLEPGTDVELCGVLRSDEKITTVAAAVYNASGAAVLSYERSWNSPRYDIQTDGLNQAMAFDTLPPGTYSYVVSAADASGTEKTLIQSSFSIAGDPLESVIPDEPAQPEETVISEEPTEEPAQPEETVIPDELTEESTQPEETVIPDELTEESTQPEETVIPDELTEESTQPEETVIPDEPTEEPAQPEETVIPDEPTEEPAQPEETIIPDEPMEEPTQPEDTVIPDEPIEEPTEPEETVIPDEPMEEPTEPEETVIPDEPMEEPTEPEETVIPDEPTEEPAQPEEFVEPEPSVPDDGETL